MPRASVSVRFRVRIKGYERIKADDARWTGFTSMMQMDELSKRPAEETCHEP